MSMTCVGCGKRFRYESDFDKHRPHGQCLDDAEMNARDMVKDKRGTWRTPNTAGKRSKQK